MSSQKRRNVVVFGTDQLRADYLGCYGNTYARTPNIDALAAQGTRYENHYTASPLCMPARACFATGRTTLANGVYDNGINLPETEVTIAQAFREAGYTTHSYGKLHHQVHLTHEGKHSYEAVVPFENGELGDWHGPYYGFQHVELAIGHGEDAWGHYGNWRKEQFPDLQIGPEVSPSSRRYPDLQLWESCMPVEAHASTWVADRAISFLKSRSEDPFFLNVSFPDPHHSFTPPKEYADRFKDIEFPPPHASDGEHDDKPLPYRLSMDHASLPYRHSDTEKKVDPLPSHGTHNPELQGDAYNMMVAHTHAMMNLVDDSIGRVIDELRAQGLEKDTIIVFASDHGDYMGDHHFFTKALLPSRSLLHVPLIIVDPDVDTRVVKDVCSNIDVMPTLLAKCGIEIPPSVQGEPLPCRPGEAMQRNYAFEAAISKDSPNLNHSAIFTDRYKIAYFPHLDDGELYDLQEDPHELVNLYNAPAHRAIRDQLMIELCRAQAQAASPSSAHLLDGPF